jgi:hypothetical protein
MPKSPTMAASTFEGVGFIRLAGDIDLMYADELRQLGEGLITDYVGPYASTCPRSRSSTRRRFPR